MDFLSAPTPQPPPSEDLRSATEAAVAACTARVVEVERQVRARARKDEQRVRVARRELRRVKKEAEAAERTETRLAERRRRGEDDQLRLAMERYAYELRQMDKAGSPLNVHVLARLGPLDAPLPPGAAPHLDPNDPPAWEARTAAYKAATVGTHWKHAPRASWPDGVPVALVDAFTVLRAVRPRILRRLLQVRRQKNGDQKMSVPIAKWPPAIQRAAQTVADILNESNQRLKWRTHENGFVVRFSVWHVISVAYDLRGATPRRPAGRTGARRTADYRTRQRDEVEQLYGGRCRLCLRSRADGVHQFQLHHVHGDGGGVHREERTDVLRRRVLRYARSHNGVAPSEVELLCVGCHRRIHPPPPRYRRAARRSQSRVARSDSGLGARNGKVILPVTIRGFREIRYVVPTNMSRISLLAERLEGDSLQTPFENTELSLRNAMLEGPHEPS
jgi:hypothetical protein